MLNNIHNTHSFVFGYSQLEALKVTEIFARILIKHGYSQMVTNLRGKHVEVRT